MASIGEKSFKITFENKTLDRSVSGGLKTFNKEDKKEFDRIQHDIYNDDK